MRLEIDNGPKVLCRKCTYGQILYDAQDTPHIYCNVMEKEIRIDVRRCTSFEQRDGPRKWQFEEIAWIIKRDKQGVACGFVRPGSKEHGKMTGF